MLTVTVLPDRIEATLRPGETIVDGLRRSGWRSPYKCRRGGCGVCKSRLAAGQVSYPLPVAESVLSAAEKADGLCLPCRAVPVTDVVVDSGAGRLRPVLASPLRYPYERFPSRPPQAEES
ncbi:MAG: 2Fe-2S iron-sulfur cluster-binding protein [Actinoplanes sp.]